MSTKLIEMLSKFPDSITEKFTENGKEYEVGHTFEMFVRNGKCVMCYTNHRWHCSIHYCIGSTYEECAEKMAEKLNN